jgi:hypothetical protein
MTISEAAICQPRGSGVRGIGWSLFTLDRAKGSRREGEKVRCILEGRATAIEALKIGEYYQTTYGTLWKDGTYFPRGTRVMVAGVHLDQGFCVRFPAEMDGEPLETWEDWAEADFLADDGSVDGAVDLSSTVLAEAREVLDEAEDGTHLHLHETED